MKIYNQIDKIAMEATVDVLATIDKEITVHKEGDVLYLGEAFLDSEGRGQWSKEPLYAYHYKVTLGKVEKVKTPCSHPQEYLHTDFNYKRKCQMCSKEWKAEWVEVKKEEKKID